MTSRRIFYVVVCVTLFFGAAWASAPASTPVLAPTAEGDLLQVLESNADRLRLQVNLPELYLEEAKALDSNFYTVAWAQGAGTGAVGKPGVPVLSTWILIPNGRTANLEVVLAGSQTVNDVYLRPEQPAAADLEDTPVEYFVIDETIYQTDADYPGEFASLDWQETMRGQSLALLSIYPYQFNPIRRTLKSFNHLEVRVNFTGELEPISKPLQDDTFEAMLFQFATNASDVLAAEHEVDEPTPPGTYGWDYLIFTKASLAQAANTLATWKQKQGYKALVNQIPAKWEAEDIRTAIRGAFMSWDVPPKYILLLGDAEIVPTFYVSDHPYNDIPYHGETDTQGLTGTDFYYSTLDRPGYGPYMDLLPDVLVGRLSVDTPADAANRVNTIIAYEQNPTQESSFYNTALLASYFQDGGTMEAAFNGMIVVTQTIPADGVEDKRNIQTSEDLAQFLVSAPQNKTVKRIYTTETEINPLKYNDNKQEGQEFINFNGPNSVVAAALPASLKRPTFTWNGNTSDIVNAINAGAFLVIHRDHGGRTRWSEPRFEAIHAAALNNPSRTPVVWSINCQTGWFDNETDFPGMPPAANSTASSSESLSEWLERPLRGNTGQYGAVGVVASSRVTFGGHNEYFYLGMADAIWPDLWPVSNGGLPGSPPLYRMSAVLNVAKVFMFQKVADTGKGLAQLEGYHWFGDPAMDIRTVKPPPMMVTVEGVWQYLLFPKMFLVHVELLNPGSQAAAPAWGARVTVFKEGSPENFWTAITDSEGYATFPDLKPSEPGEYQIWVNAPNTIPGHEAFEVEPGPSGGVGLDQTLYACGQRVGVSVADADLANSDEMEVNIQTSEGDVEDIPLFEGQAAGYFTGEIDTASGNSIPGDGILQVRDEVEIRVAYQDAADERGEPVVATETARVDCQAPSFDGLLSLTGGACRAALGWEPASDLSTPIQYNVYRLQPPAAPLLLGSTFATSFNDYVCWPGKTYAYMVRAQDRVGLEDGNNVVKSVTYYGFFLPMLMR